MSEGLQQKRFGLHPVQEAQADTTIVFVHGILSSGAEAWGKPSWPELLAAEPDMGSANIYVFTYRTAAFSHTYSISDVASILREHMRLAGLGRIRTLIFVCHSMGGLVVRRLLVAYRDELAANGISVGLFLVASPSLGSRDANTLSLLSCALQHTQLAALRFTQSNIWLNDLHSDFKSLLASGTLRIEGRELVEDRAITVKRWLGIRRQVVEPFAAAQYFSKPGCEPLKIPGSDHKDIVKPGNATAIQHLTLKSFIRHVLAQDSVKRQDLSRSTARPPQLEVRPHAVGKRAPSGGSK